MQEVGVTEGENLPALLLQALLSCFQECVLACTSLLRLCIWIEEDGPAWPLFGTKRQLSTYSSHYSSVTNYKAQYFSVSNILAGSQSSVFVGARRFSASASGSKEVGLRGHCLGQRDSSVPTAATIAVLQITKLSTFQLATF
jgi:hypothetical protein